MITPIIGILSGIFWCIINEGGSCKGRSREYCIHITNFTNEPILIAPLLRHQYLDGAFERVWLGRPLSKFLENFFHRLHTLRHKDLEAILDDFWNAQMPIRPRQPLKSLEPLHLPRLKLQKHRLANLDLLTQSQDPQQTLLDASPSPSKRSNHPSQICDAVPEFLGPSKWSEDPGFE
jgi:hypothetical protein